VTTETRCSLCGKDPADGYAFHDDKRYCHGDEPGTTCFIAWWENEWRQKGAEHE
jgi:hypothetical protein